MCGNILPFPLRAMIVAIEQISFFFFLLNPLHISYTSVLNQAEEGKVFFSLDRCLETGDDPRNFCDKQYFL